MNLMIVDDSIQTVKAIQTSIDWACIGIAEVYTAYNISQAKAVFEKQSIDILISDIEMPYGSGMDLIKWVKVNSPHTESILLTCHADFEYARMAIELGSFDYLLKPMPFAELEEIVQKLIAKMEAGRKLKKNSEFWIDNQPLLEERFWSDVLFGKIPANRAAIEECALKRNISINNDSEYLLILLTKKRLITRLQEIDQDGIFQEMRKMAEEMILHNQPCNSILIMNEQMVIKLDSQCEGNQNVNRIKNDCIQYILECSRKLGSNISCYIGNYAKIVELPVMLSKLLRMDQENVLQTSKVFDLNDAGNGEMKTEIHMPNLNEWALLLHNGENGHATEKAMEYIEGLVRAGRINAKILSLLHQDILQMLFSFLEQKGIQAHRLFEDDHSEKLYTNAKKSTDDLINWISYAFDKSVSYVNEIAKTQSVVEKVKEYIKNHYKEDISREDMAAFVFLNPDYLTRIFKKVTGLSISEFLTEQRINLSMRLLAGTNMRISEIAMEIDYNNINYFSTMFRKYTGVTPMEYRKQSNSPQTHI